MSEYVPARLEVVMQAAGYDEGGARGAARVAFYAHERRASAELLMVAARQTLSEAVRLRFAAALADDERDALGDEELCVAQVVVDREPCKAVVQRLLDRLDDEIAVARGVGQAGNVLAAVVADSGHGAPPSVGGVGGGSSTPSIPTVGVRPDASADVPPSAGASVADLRADIKRAIGEVGGATADVLAERLFFLGWRRR